MENLLWSAPAFYDAEKISSNYLVFIHGFAHKTHYQSQKLGRQFIITLHPNKIKRNIPEQFWEIFPTAATK